MQAYQHILIAVNHSGSDQVIINKARKLADLYRAKLSIIHVLDDIPMPDTAYGTRINLDDASDNQLLEIEKRRLALLADAISIDHSCSWLVWGSPHHEIAQLAEQENIDLIVLGSHPRHGFALLLGSTTNSVLHHAKCDLLAVNLAPEE